MKNFMLSINKYDDPPTEIRIPLADDEVLARDLFDRLKSTPFAYVELQITTTTTISLSGD